MTYQRMVLPVVIEVNRDEWVPGWFGDPTDTSRTAVRGEVANRVYDALVDALPDWADIEEIRGTEY